MFNLFNKDLSEIEKFKLLRKKTADYKVASYLIERLRFINFEVLSRYSGNMFDLMVECKLMGWCWETTESVVPFLNDNDYIERGHLMIDSNTPRYLSFLGVF